MQLRQPQYNWLRMGTLCSNKHRHLHNSRCISNSSNSGAETLMKSPIGTSAPPAITTLRPTMQVSALMMHAVLMFTRSVAGMSPTSMKSCECRGGPDTGDGQRYGEGAAQLSVRGAASAELRSAFELQVGAVDCKSSSNGSKPTNVPHAAMLYGCSYLSYCMLHSRMFVLHPCACLYMQGDINSAHRQGQRVHVCEPVSRCQVPWARRMRQSLPMPEHARSAVVRNEGTLSCLFGQHLTCTAPPLLA